MHAPPNSGNVAARIAGPAIGAIIPVYTPTKTATLNPDLRKSREGSMTLDLDRTSSGRRKRQAMPPSNLTSYVGGKFGPYGNTLVENGIRKVLRERREFEDVTVSSVTVTQEPNGRKKRLSLVKRQFRSRVVLVVRFVIFFARICDYGCQLKVGPIFTPLLQYNLPSALFLINVPILNAGGGLFATISSIPIIGVLSITNIYPARYPFVAPTSPPTVSITPATTSATTTTPALSVNMG
ncbi:unnamed protein product [Rotaria sordida]|uniref:Uncharacterized protein n=1 Tax=Rotaria sordida TaxID=392033 RepID=A0A815KC77_9BILA|nr:unnamed protein product [Rotaria sordida]